MSASWGSEGASNNADKNGQWKGWGLVVSGTFFSLASVREKMKFKGNYMYMILLLHQRLKNLEASKK